MTLMVSVPELSLRVEGSHRANVTRPLRVGVYIHR